MTERDVLRRAKEVLLERGWHQGQFCSDMTGERGRVCLVGALGVAAHGDPFQHRGTKPAARVIRDVLGCDLLGEVAVWNDGVAASVDDVIALIDRAIASLPAEEVTPEGEKEAAHAAA